eukprot:334039-Pelagomonas_calceolata.AAC.1
MEARPALRGPLLTPLRRILLAILRRSRGHCRLVEGYKGYKGKGPQSRRLTAILFINTHEVMKKKRKFVVILVNGVKTGHPVGDVEV